MPASSTRRGDILLSPLLVLVLVVCLPAELCPAVLSVGSLHFFSREREREKKLQSFVRNWYRRLDSWLTPHNHTNANARAVVPWQQLGKLLDLTHC